MNRKPILPPTWLFASVVLMVGLHFVLPLARIVPAPWNLAGLLPLVVGLWLNVRASGLFRRASTTIKPFERPASLVADGPYRFSRHPMYLGMALVLVGVGVMLGTLGPLVVVPAFVWAMEVAFIRAEERDMEAVFGEEYRAYRRRVRRWI